MRDEPAAGTLAERTGEAPAAGPLAKAGRRRSAPEAIGLLVFLALEIVFFSIRSPYFLNWENWGNIHAAVAITGVLAGAGTLLLIAGQFDLAVGSGGAFVGIVLVQTAPSLGIGPAVVLSVLAGLGIG